MGGLRKRPAWCTMMGPTRVEAEVQALEPGINRVVQTSCFAEQRAQDAEARAALSERRLRIMELDLAHMKQTNSRLLRDYENAVGEKQSLKSAKLKATGVG